MENTIKNGHVRGQEVHQHNTMSYPPASQMALLFCDCKYDDVVTNYLSDTSQI